MIVSGYLFETVVCLDGLFSSFSLACAMFLQTCRSVSALEQWPLVAAYLIRLWG